MHRSAKLRSIRKFTGTNKPENVEMHFKTSCALQDRSGDTNLIHAAKAGHKSIVEALLKKYADVDLTGKVMTINYFNEPNLVS